MYQLRPVALKPGEQLLECRPARVARSHLMRRTVEPGNELADQRSIDLAQRLNPLGPALAFRKKAQPVADARTEGRSPHRRILIGEMPAERERQLARHHRRCAQGVDIEAPDQIAALIEELYG